MSGFRCQERETQELKPVENPVCSEAAAGNTETRNHFLKGHTL